MARDDQPVKLKILDEEADVTAPVVRLGKPLNPKKQVEERPMRLETKDEADEVKLRLDLPSREDIELRTHQPDIHSLIETETTDPDCVEQAWEVSTVREKPIPWGWFALIAVILAAAVIWSLTRVQDSGKQAAQIRQETQTVLVDEEKENQEAALLVDRIDQAIRTYFATDNVEALIRQVRQPERVGPLIRGEYAKKPVFTADVRSIKWLQPLTLDNRGNFWMSKVVLTDGSIQNIIIEILPTGEPKIDWETLVCHQPMAWNDFVSQRPKATPMDFRVKISSDHFYSHEFSNSQQWKCFRLDAKGSEEYLFGYIPAGSELENNLRELLRQNGGKNVSVILRLSIPDGILSHRGVVIEKIQSTRWMYLDSPDSGS